MPARPTLTAVSSAAAGLASSQGIARSLAMLLAAATLLLSGCRGHAYREVYQQKMLSEIRTLEDQLYEADYHNQVLIDELERSQRKVEFQAAKRSRDVDPNSSRPRRSASSSAEFDESDGSPGIGAPPTRQPRLPARPTQADPFVDDPESPPAGNRTLPARPNNRGTGVPERLDTPETLEPPQIHLPPGPDDLTFPDVELGTPVPPAGLAALDELPPGHVKLPSSTQRHVIEQLPPPASIRINTSRSGGYRFEDSDADHANDAEGAMGMQLTIEAIDDRGRQVDLTAFDIEGELSVVLLDPEQGGADARLGRWDFDAQQLHEMGHSGGNSALHVYLPWQGKLPQGSEVIAHVKLVAEESQMQAQATLRTVAAEIVGWNPRAESLGR